MHYEAIHDFDDLSTGRMRALQEELRARIVARPLKKVPRIASGVDLAYAGGKAVAVIVTMEIDSLEILEEVSVVADVGLPFIPGYLAFRELPPFLKAWNKATVEPDVVFFDGQGQLHPRRMGIATHASFFIGKPTVGVAKSRLCGSYEEPAMEAGSLSPVYDGEEVIGAVVRSRANVRPIFVSAGNAITLEEAVALTKRFITPKSRIPLITGLADK
ncbi:MAG: endonuclease V, partial [Campylobacterales bacterium]